MNRNGVELLTVVNPGSSRRVNDPWWRGDVALGYRRYRDRLIGEALPRGEAKKLADWWNENYQPQGQHVHHFLRLNRAYSRGRKKLYDVVREVVEKNPEDSGWTKGRLKWFLGAGLISSVAYGLYRDARRSATTAEEVRRVSNYFWGFTAVFAVGAYLLFGEKLKQMAPQMPKRNRRKVRLSDVDFEFGAGCGVEGYDAFVGEELIGEIAAYEHEDGFHYRLADEWAWMPADSLDEAKRGLVAEYNMEMLEEHCLESNPSVDDLVWFEVEIDGIIHWNAFLKGQIPVGVVTTFPGEPGFQYRVEGSDVWYRASSFEDAKEELFDQFMEEKVTGPDPWEWDGYLPDWWPSDPDENPATRYFVHLPDEGVSYPKPGSEYYPKGYPLKKAQDFARIGSQEGGPRDVRRGRRGGKKVRTYKKGKRTWPTKRGQVKNLLPSEVPKRLRAS